MLDFISQENEHHRAYFGALFEKTAWVLGILIASVGIAATFVGWNTISGARQSAQSTVKENVNALRPQIDKEVKDGVSDEFSRPNIDLVVQQAARDATATTANKLIRDEVSRQVSTAMSGEREVIKGTLIHAADNAVGAVKQDIQRETDRATTKIIEDRLGPKLKSLDQYTDATVAILAARSDDGVAFDKLVAISRDASAAPELQRLAQTTIDSIQNAPNARERVDYCPMKHTLDPSDLAAELKGGDKDKHLHALACIVNLNFPATWLGIDQPDVDRVYPLMDRVFELMDDDPSLAVRVQAYYAFYWVAKKRLPDSVELPRMLDNSFNTSWWRANRGKFIN